jgi:hypothetical protein
MVLARVIQITSESIAPLRQLIGPSPAAVQRPRCASAERADVGLVLSCGSCGSCGGPSHICNANRVLGKDMTITFEERQSEPGVVRLAPVWTVAHSPEVDCVTDRD